MLYERLIFPNLTGELEYAVTNSPISKSYDGSVSTKYEAEKEIVG